MNDGNVVTPQEFCSLTESVKLIIQEKLAPLPKEELVALILLSGSIIGNDVLNKKDPNSTKSALESLNMGLSFIFSKHEKAKIDLGMQPEIGLFH